MSVLQAPAPQEGLKPPIEFVPDTNRRGVFGVLIIAVLTFTLHGFHPFREDASIYVAGIERRLDPLLFARDTLFVDGHTRLSLFSWLSAGLVSKCHISLETLLMLFYCGTVVAFLAGCQAVATRLFKTERERWGATLLAGLCFTLPAAATSLLIMDSYVTARSFTTPLSLFAIAACCDRKWAKVLCLTTLVVLLHPLMGVYLVSFLLLFTLARIDHRRWAILLLAGGLLLCGLLAFRDYASVISPEFREAALSRTYYFLSNWQWYELGGLAVPLLLLARVAVQSRRGSLLSQISFACLLLGGTATLASVLFVHPAHLGLLTRLQVLRSFHTIYLLGVILLGGHLGAWLSGKRIWFALPLALGLAAAMYLGDERPYTHLGHIDWPLAQSRDPWINALLWIRSNTPANAIFAAAPQELEALKQTSTGFRSVTRRSILTDIKDEGIASIFPASAAEWASRRDAQRGLSDLAAANSTSQMRRYGVEWLLLPPAVHAPFVCPYRNAVVAVCHMQQQQTP